MAYLYELPKSNVRDIPAVLRRWADDLEAGDHGNATGMVLVIDADEICVSYAGEGEAAPNAMLLLQVGIGTLVQAVLDAKA